MDLVLNLANTLHLLSGLVEGASGPSAILDEKKIDHRSTLKPLGVKIDRLISTVTDQGLLKGNISPLTLVSLMSQIKEGTQLDEVEFEVFPALAAFLKDLPQSKAIEAVSAIANLLLGSTNKHREAKDFGYVMGVGFLKFLEKNLVPVSPSGTQPQGQAKGPLRIT